MNSEFPINSFNNDESLEISLVIKVPIPKSVSIPKIPEKASANDNIPNNSEPKYLAEYIVKYRVKTKLTILAINSSNVFLKSLLIVLKHYVLHGLIRFNSTDYCVININEYTM